jgi:hypothetical protein
MGIAFIILLFSTLTRNCTYFFYTHAAPAANPVPARNLLSFQSPSLLRRRFAVSDFTNIFISPLETKPNNAEAGWATCCCLLLQYLIQSCARGGRRTVEDMCYEIQRAGACVD